MWLVLNRTRLGMLIRAGVDDREMLAASGVRIQYVFLAVFAFGAGLAGMAGIVGGTFQSLSPGEDTRFLLASLVVVIVGGMGSIPGAAIGALIIGLSEQLGLVYAPTYSVVFTFLIMAAVLAFRPQGLLGRAVSHGAGRDPDRIRPPRCAAAPEKLGRTHPAGLVGAGLLPSDMPAWANDFILFQVFGWTFILGMIALSLMFLAGYGGMVSLIQMSVAAMAGYMVAIFGSSGIAEISWACRGGSTSPSRSSSRDLRHHRRRARGADRGHLHDHDHARDRGGVLLFHPAELHDLQRLYRLQPGGAAAALRGGLAPADAVLLPDAGLRGDRLSRRSSMSRARPSGWRCRACATTRGAWRRWASTSPRTASRPIPSPA
jgi:ABC-type branched-subunit amino acid transport system permease subunit